MYMNGYKYFQLSNERAGPSDDNGVIQWEGLSVMAGLSNEAYLMVSVDGIPKLWSQVFQPRNKIDMPPSGILPLRVDFDYWPTVKIV